MPDHLTITGKAGSITLDARGNTPGIWITKPGCKTSISIYLEPKGKRAVIGLYDEDRKLGCSVALASDGTLQARDKDGVVRTVSLADVIEQFGKPVETEKECACGCHEEVSNEEEQSND